MRIPIPTLLCPLMIAVTVGGAEETVGPTVPLIDLKPWLMLSAKSNDEPTQDRLIMTPEQQDVVDQIHQACRTVGFFLIQNHGFDQSVMENAWKASRDFFSVSTEEKMMHKTTNEAEYPYGYEQSETLARGKQLDTGSDERIPQEGEYYNGNSNSTVLLVQDLKETFAVGPDNPDSGMPPRRWIQSPNVSPKFPDALQSYYQHMERLSLVLLEIFALALDEDASYFKSKMDHHLSALRLAHYFPLETSKDDLHVVRAGAHTDYGALTILAAQEKGLEVLLEGKWVPVPLVKDAFIINLGDLMQRWTNDQWVSTMHRVAMPSTDALEQRYSMAYFVNVNGDAVIEPLPSCVTGDSQRTAIKYPPITAGDHLMAKHLASMGESHGNSLVHDEL